MLAPPGTVVNVNFPGPSVGGNTETHCRIANVVMGALAPGLKERSAATDGASHSNFLFGGADAKTGRVFLLLRPDACRLGRPQLCGWQ